MAREPGSDIMVTLRVSLQLLRHSALSFQAGRSQNTSVAQTGDPVN